MNQVQHFNFNQSQVRVEMHNGEPLFCLTDVAQILEIQNTKSSRFNLKEDGVHKMYLTDKLGRDQEATFINEPNLYRVIFRSRKAEAVKFQDWIFEEVIPQIRKTGSYQVPKLNPQKPRKALPNGLSGEQQEAVIQLHKTLVQAVPKSEQGKLAITLWSAVKSKYGVSYKELPPEMFAEVLSLMSRVAVEKGVLYGEVLDAEPKPAVNPNIPCIIKAAEALCSYFEATYTAVASLNRPLYGKTVEHYKILKIYAPRLV
nr:MAG TPA: hypothetical protein [Caudoviricetes sp.]